MNSAPYKAVTADRFAELMAPLGHFEVTPHLAVACSGGADSMALALLADEWTRCRGGRLTALVVDHALRDDSAAEASRVKSWLRARDIETFILTRTGAMKPANRQAMARRARYDLLSGWCRAAGVVHLLLGHNRRDQAETFLLRLARGSGVDGLAAMAPVLETAGVRLLRPLLDVSRGELEAILCERGQEFVSDPSNEDLSYARVRVRRMLPSLAAEGMTQSRLCATARRLARARVALEDSATGLLGRAAAIFPEGYARLDPAQLLGAPEEIGLRALARTVTCIGGREYGPRLDRLERLYGWLCDGAQKAGGRTLSGCRILRRGGGLLVCREASAAASTAPVVDGAVWDNRFRLNLPGRAPDGAELRKLGRKGWAEIVAYEPGLRNLPVPEPVRCGLPTIWGLDGVLVVPHLKYQRTLPGGQEFGVDDIEFHPPRPLGAARFRVDAGFARG